MPGYIERVKLNLWKGLLVEEIIFSDGLNIISGSNGTGKTKLLQFIQQHNNGDQQILLSDGTFVARISAFSPQRDAKKHLAQQAMNFFRQDVNATQTALGAFQNKFIEDDGFQALKSISEYFVYSAEDETIKDGSVNKNDASETIRKVFEDVIKKVFDFDIRFFFNPQNKSYDLKFIKNGIDLEVNDLSHGENAVIVLMCALIFGKDSAETFLIDEPETHLNWSLEEKLFEFFDWYCEEYGKQIVTVTHSRVVFLDKYKNKRQFFERTDSGILISENPSKRLVDQLAGDTVHILEGITSKSRLVYVEDEFSKAIIEKISGRLKLGVEVQVAGNCSNVKNVAKAFKSLPIDNVYFLVDGDNKPLLSIDKKDLHKNIVQLNKYCIQNYLLNVDVLNLYKNQDWDGVLKAMIEAIDVKSEPKIKPVQVAIARGASANDLIDYIDGSYIFKGIAISEKKGEYVLMGEMLDKIQDTDLLGKYFEELSFLQS